MSYRWTPEQVAVLRTLWEILLPLPAEDGRVEALRLIEAEILPQSEAVASPSERSLACGQCGGPHQFDTSVPSVLWNQVVRAQSLSDYLCTSCVVRAFLRAGVSFTAELYGDGLSGERINVTGAPSR